jgi:hypothetical protein
MKALALSGLGFDGALWISVPIILKCLSENVKVQVSLCLAKQHAMKTYGGMEVQLLTSALDGGECSTLQPLYQPGNEPKISFRLLAVRSLFHGVSTQWF